MAAQSYKTITFKTAFSSANYNVSLTVDPQNRDLTFCDAQIHSLSSTNMQVANVNNSGITSIIHWRCIGY